MLMRTLRVAVPAQPVLSNRLAVSCGFFGDQLELLRPPLGRGAAGEGPEVLLAGVVLLVQVEDPQQRLVELPMRDLLDDDLAELRVRAETAADADVHRLDELAVDLLEHALDPDVGDLVLRAAR